MLIHGWEFGWINYSLLTMDYCEATTNNEKWNGVILMYIPKYKSKVKTANCSICLLAICEKDKGIRKIFMYLLILSKTITTPQPCTWKINQKLVGEYLYKVWKIKEEGFGIGAWNVPVYLFIYFWLQTMLIL